MAPISTSSGKPIIRLPEPNPNAQMGKNYSFCIAPCVKEREFNSCSTFSCENKKLLQAVHVTVMLRTCPMLNTFGMIQRICITDQMPLFFFFQTYTWVLPHRIKRSCLIFYRTITSLYELKKFPLKKSIRQQTWSPASVTFFVCVV